MTLISVFDSVRFYSFLNLQTFDLKPDSRKFERMNRIGQNITRKSNTFEAMEEMIELWNSAINEAHNLKNKDRIIIGVAVLSSLLVLILVYLIIIRPYLKRKAEASTE